VPGGAFYAASKHAVEGFTDALRLSTGPAHGSHARPAAPARVPPVTPAVWQAGEEDSA
jgi:NAD(P)-dependent dehydrogenase (short-subunit alcohol dehydrogenase family)